LETDGLGVQSIQWKIPANGLPHAEVAETDRSVAEVTHSAVQLSRASDQDGDVLFGCGVELGSFIRVFFWPEFRYVERSHSGLVRPFVGFRLFGLRSTHRT
jgi:hypothetical protein